MFLHGGWFHLVGNLWFLWVFGDNVEDAMGGARFALFYVLCGLAAFAAQAATGPSSAIPMVGASGAIGGVMGAYARLYPRAPVHLLIIFFVFVDRTVVPAFLMLGYWFVIQVRGRDPRVGLRGRWRRVLGARRRLPRGHPAGIGLHEAGARGGAPRDDATPRWCESPALALVRAPC